MDERDMERSKKSSLALLMGMILGVIKAILKLAAIIVVLCFAFLAYLDIFHTEYTACKMNVINDKETVMEECPEVEFTEEDLAYFERIYSSGIVNTLDLTKHPKISGQEAAELIGLDLAKYSKAEVLFEYSSDVKIIEHEYTSETVVLDGFRADVRLYSPEYDCCPTCVVIMYIHNDSSDPVGKDCFVRAKYIYKDIAPHYIKRGIKNYDYDADYTCYWNRNDEDYEKYRIVIEPFYYLASLF